MSIILEQAEKLQIAIEAMRQQQKQDKFRSGGEVHAENDQ